MTLAGLTLQVNQVLAMRDENCIVFAQNLQSRLPEFSVFGRKVGSPLFVEYGAYFPRNLGFPTEHKKHYRTLGAGGQSGIVRRSFAFETHSFAATWTLHARATRAKAASRRRGTADVIGSGEMSGAKGMESHEKPRGGGRSPPAAMFAFARASLAVDRETREQVFKLIDGRGGDRCVGNRQAGEIWHGGKILNSRIGDCRAAEQ